MLTSLCRLRIPHGKSPAALFALLGGPALAGLFTLAWAEGPPAREVPAATAAATAPAPGAADLAALGPLVTFLRDYHQALGSGNQRFLAEHTVFPLPFAQAEYEMETKVRPAKLASVAKLLKLKQLLRWPQALLPRGPADIARLHRGTERCADPKAPDVPDYTSGPPALAVHGDQATLSYLAEPCAAETHMVTLTFARDGAIWRLRGRAVRLGTK